MKRFLYQPLPSNQVDRTFRLLDLLPGDTEGLECNLKVVSLDEVPEYEAISYCWGDHSLVNQIRCEGALLNIPESLHSALRYLRDKSQIRILWADAICINQSDADEKGNQIPLMRNIFFSAVRVLAWLGEEFDDSDLAISFILSLYPTIDKAPPFANPLADFNRNEQRAWRAFSKLLDRPWFCRLWVIQEIAVASTVVVYCGRSFLMWDVLEGVCQFTLRSAASMKLISSGYEAIFTLGNIRSQIKQGIELNVLQVLLTSRSFHASDPRDKLYGICGLTHDSGPQHLNIQVNYRNSPEDIYRELAIAILTKSRSLDLLSVPRHTQHSKLTTLPSWVPDWSAGDHTTCRRLRESICEECPEFRATAGSDYTPLFLRDGTLALTGEIVDEITMVGPELGGPSNSPTSQKQVKKNFQTHYKNLVKYYDIVLARRNEIYITGEQMVDVFCQTLLGGYGDELDLKQMAACLRVWRLLYSIRCHGSTWAHATAKWLIQYIHPGIWGSSDIQENYSRMAYNMNTSIGGRRIMHSRRGYIGTVSSNTCPGDMIGIFKGGKVPLIVRPKGDCWQLIGDSYIHGLMFAELFNEGNCQIVKIL